MKITDADSLFATLTKAITDLFVSDTVDQAAIDKCCALPLSNSADIANIFAGHGGFISWYNATLASTAAFRHRGKISTDAGVASRFDAFWNQIPAIFSAPRTSALEFAAVMCLGIQENNGDMSCDPEKVGTEGYPGLAYAFEKIPGLKSSYNVNDDLGNWTALKLFKDAGYVAEHQALAGYHQVVDRGIDPAWGTTFWPKTFPTKPDTSVNGFVMEADFFKFRGRGVIQTTGREDYGVLIDYVMNNAPTLGNANLTQLRGTWDAYPAAGASKKDTIASRSTNAHWDTAFGEGIILAAAISEDSRIKSDYLKLATDAKTLNGGKATKGSLYFMARKINGGSYPDEVVPMMKALIRAIAAL
ncbi:hypothetical protein BKD09_27180 [Bradyrhizobium japonicum]|uniref:Uncharacterized protein n=1 Tax=Bradyrhizobium japonicum TaxID=375 RepID=A0A1L3FFD9_BRAJP|nr:hypothetical protein [Bradyrhizobium japonicum]APG12025.1 hypothetical protein BKD09_27180 [Bradyrhizobium japonicum]